jgi:hypothetical protein
MFNQMPNMGLNPNMLNNQNQMPYAYGLMNQNPLPMYPSPIASLPPLYPSSQTPQLNPQAPFTNPNQLEARYAHGGRVHPQNLSEMADYLSEEGEGDDTILAHINPEEAMELGLEHGMDINPYTGLPQFGFWKKLKRIFRKALPLAGALAGNTLLPGIGAPLGGALTGALSGQARGKSPFKAALRGAGVGAGVGYGLPMVGKGLSGLGMTNVGRGLEQIGGGQYGNAMRSFGSALGRGSENALVSRNPIYTEELAPLTQGVNQGASKDTSSFFGSSGLGGLGGMSSWLLPIALGGMLMRNEKMRPNKSEPNVGDIQNELKAFNRLIGPRGISDMWRPDQYPRPIRPLIREQLDVPDDIEEAEGRKAGYHKKYFRDVNPRFAKGGYIYGDSGGQDDDVEMDLPENSYIINATAVSHLGDGNSAAGARKLDRFFHDLEHTMGLSQYKRHNSGGYTRRSIPAKVSQGEYRVEPHQVSLLGKGNNQNGAKKLDLLQKNVMRHKGVKGLPPKAKSLSSYMRQRHR